ncbi:MAG: O-antigen ligase family protein [bacterium]
MLSIAFAGSALLSAWAAGDIAGAGPTLVLVAGTTIVLVVGRRVAPLRRAPLITGVIALGCIVAVSGWVGVAWHFAPWGLEDSGIYRAATTLTYANAAAGFLVPISLLALARLAQEPGSAPSALAATILLVGVGATLSRAGMLALIAGLIVLARLMGRRPILAAVGPPVAGAVVALTGLLPSITGNARPLPAATCCLIGVALGTLRGWRKRPPVGVLVGLSAAAASLLLIAGAWQGGTTTSLRSRVTPESSDRLGEAGAALRVASQHPLLGTGPGRASLSWTDPHGGYLLARYAHDEYLQVLAEQGVLGALVIVALVIAINWGARQGRATILPEIWAGAVAGLVALAGHSAFDFLWHVPALPLLAALLVTACTLPTPKEST